MIEIVQGDITTLDVDAIVNAANSSLMGGGGVDGAIHRAAGPELVRASSALGPIATGDAVITPGFNLRARFVIHAVGPVWQSGAEGEAELLKRAYERSFEAARGEPAIRSIALPAISTGVYGYPKIPAAEIALGVMHDHDAEFDRIVACLFDGESLIIYQTVEAERARSTDRPDPRS